MSASPPSTPAREVASYYRHEAVRDRVREYAADAIALAGFGGRTRRRDPDDWGPVAVPPGQLDGLFEEGADVCRSMADSGGTLLLLDLDYGNTEDPGEAYRDASGVFDRIEPVYVAVLDALAAYHVRPLVLMTARGWHFVARVPRGSRLSDGLVRLGTLPPTLRSPGLDAPARAHAGAGKLVEHLGHRILERVRGRCDTPVDLADVPAPGRGGLVCLDLSAYADPLATRFSRCAFSSNQKAWMSESPDGHPYVVALPRDSMAPAELLLAREDLDLAARAAERLTVRIPDVPDESVSLLEAYERGPLVRLHTDLDEAWDEPEPAPEPDLDALPACAAWALRHPDPSLLQPGFIRTVTLALRAHGWPPAAVVEVIRARYRSEPALAPLFRRYDAASRAAFYVRLFSGALEAGFEIHDDFTCAGQAARGLCVGGECGHEVGRLFDSLRGRRDLS